MVPILPTVTILRPHDTIKGNRADCSLAMKSNNFPMQMQLVTKKDRYLRERGGRAAFLILTCAHCGGELAVYQKDGPGNLLRCYLNRFFYPEAMQSLQNNLQITQPNDLPTWKCADCHSIIGHPMRYRDGRLAFRLVQGAYAKQKLKQDALNVA
jgi:RNase P subunit RPR2